MTPLILGILNVTPDSFSDGGLFFQLESALRHGEKLVAEGADFLDVGGESTRPGASPVSVAEEIDRVVPVVERLRREFAVPVSIDTRKAEVAKAAIAAGATLINDVSGGRDPGMVPLACRPGVSILLMHMQGEPQTMQENPTYPRGVVTEVKEYLAQRVQAFVEAGVPTSRIWIDPGIGFGKTLEQNLELLRRLEGFVGLAGRLAIGTSRKSFLARLLGNPQMPIAEREPGTLASCLWARAKGASVFRVHEVGAMKRALLTWETLNAR